MFERLTIDVLAEKVSDQLLLGEPDAKLAHRFFRKGRRDGKHAFDGVSVQQLLVDAVGIAGSVLAIEFAGRQEALERQLALAHQALAQHRKALDELQKSEQASETSADAVGDLPARVPATVADGVAPGSSDELAVALVNRRHLVAEKARKAAEEAARAEHQAAVSQAEQGISDSERAIADLTEALEGLPDVYLERFERILHTARLLWSRYCNGFEQGRYRWFARDREVVFPADSLEIEPPAVFDPFVQRPTEQVSELAISGGGDGS